MSLGGWEVKISDGMPQKVATAFGELNDLLGVEYVPIKYIGSQVVNGINHAVLAEQTLILGKDIKNVVVIIFHETKEGVSVSSIERVVESGGEFGGIKVDVQAPIPDEAQKAFDEVFEGFVGANVKPFALLGTQVTKGVNYIFAATHEPVVKEPTTRAVLITVNPLDKKVSFAYFLTSKQDATSLGYAFTWQAQQDTSVGKPLGEWP